jgi:hypothetical protein
MPANVLYQIPVASWPIRLIMGAVCLLFVVGTYGWWLPRATPALLRLPRKSAGSTVVNVVLAVLPLAIGVGPLGVLFMLIRNPIAYVTDTGVMQEGNFSRTLISIPWGDVAHVYCRSQSNGVVRALSVVAADGRVVGFGNASGVDLASMYQLYQSQLGPAVVHRCVVSGIKN